MLNRVKDLSENFESVNFLHKELYKNGLAALLNGAAAKLLTKSKKLPKF